MEEIWKKIKENNYYEVSNLGRVKSIDREIRNNKGFCLKKGRILKPRLHTAGYLRVNININNKNTDRYIHRLVAEAFIDNYSTDLIINHKDGNKKNNLYSNLECCTQKENVEHAFNIGLNKCFGENNHFSKLSKEKVDLIRSYKETKSLENLAKEFNVTKATISRILNNKIWNR